MLLSFTFMLILFVHGLVQGSGYTNSAGLIRPGFGPPPPPKKAPRISDLKKKLCKFFSHFQFGNT